MGNNMTLTEWKTNIANQPGKKMYWYESFWRQINFMNNDIVHLLIDLKKMKEFDKKYGVYNSEWIVFRDKFMTVLSTHTSKSILLPVYDFKYKGVRFIVRYNFHDWKISVISKSDIEINPVGLFDPTSKSIHPVYFEGFPEKLVFQGYNTKNNKDKFSIEIYNNFGVYTFFWYLKHHATT